MKIILMILIGAIEFYTWIDEHGIKHVSNVPRECIVDGAVTVECLVTSERKQTLVKTPLPSPTAINLPMPEALHRLIAAASVYNQVAMECEIGFRVSMKMAERECAGYVKFMESEDAEIIKTFAVDLNFQQYAKDNMEYMDMFQLKHDLDQGNKSSTFIDRYIKTR